MWVQCLLQGTCTSVDDWVQVVGRDLGVSRIVTHPTGEALVELAARVGQIRVDRLQPHHVYPILTKTWAIQGQFNLERKLSCELFDR